MHPTPLPLIPMLMCDDIISQEAGSKQGEQNRNPEKVLLSLPKKRPIGTPSGDYGAVNINDTAQTQREIEGLETGDKEHCA